MEAVANKVSTRFIRRQIRKQPLIAFLLIRERYPDFTREEMDQAILKCKPLKPRKKHREKRGFRDRQLHKLCLELKRYDEDSREYGQLVSRISAMKQALDEKRDIRLTISYKGESRGYFFKWNSSEDYIKRIAALANQCSSFEEFEQRKNNNQ